MLGVGRLDLGGVGRVGRMFWMGRLGRLSPGLTLFVLTMMVRRRSGLVRGSPCMVEMIRMETL